MRILVFQYAFSIGIALVGGSAYDKLACLARLYLNSDAGMVLGGMLAIGSYNFITINLYNYKFYNYKKIIIIIIIIIFFSQLFGTSDDTYIIRNIYDNSYKLLTP